MIGCVPLNSFSPLVLSPGNIQPREEMDSQRDLKEKVGYHLGLLSLQNRL